MDARLKYQFDSNGSLPDVASARYQTYTVDSGIDSSRAVQFQVPGQPDCFIDLSECYLKTVFNVVKQDGTSIGSNPPVFPAENYGSNLWSQVQISLNNTPLPPGNEYPYTAYLIDILGASSETQSNVLNDLAGFAVPSYGSSLIEHARSNSYREKKRLCRDSQFMEVYSRIHSDFMMSCSQLLPNNMSLGVTLQRSQDSFVLGAETKTTMDPATATDKTTVVDPVKIQVKSATLFVKRVCLNPAARAEIDKGLADGGNLLYQRLQTVAIQCPKGLITWNWHNCFNHVAPRKVFLALVTQEAYFGSLKRTSSFLESANIATVRFALDGRDIMAEPYQTKFVYDSKGKIDDVNTQARSAYAGLCRAIGSFSAIRQNNGISYSKFVDGATVFAVDLDHADTGHPSTGSLDVSITFAEKSEETYMVILMGEFPKIVSFDANRNISFP